MSSLYMPFAQTSEQDEKQRIENKTAQTWSSKDWWTGFKEENLFAKTYEWMKDNSDFPAEENYIPEDDPQLKNYKDYMQHFYFSQSKMETAAIIAKLKKHAENNYASPWYHLGRVTGAFTDPSTALLFTKVGQAAKVFGTALVGEELLKQNMDSMRDDNYVPYVAAAGYGIPLILNKLANGNITTKTAKETKQLDLQWNGTVSKESTPSKLYEDGQFVNPNKLDKPPSGVGAEGVSTTKLSTPQKRLEGEEFVKSKLWLFGEEGPWTPVFRVTKSISSNARNMIANILDTPLLKLKNTKEWGFEATNTSLETQLRMMEIGVLNSMREIKDLYLKYLERTKQKVPTTDIGITLKNTLTKNTNSEKMSLREFSYEITKARIAGNHEIAEVAAAARRTNDLVYKPLFDEVKALKMREIPIRAELNFWENILKDMRTKTGETYKTFTSKIDGKTTKHSLTEIENKIAKLNKRLINAQGEGVKNYINIIYNKNAINKNSTRFKEIIRGHFQRSGIVINESKLSQLVDDLSNHFPFVRFEKTPWAKLGTRIEALQKGGFEELNSLLARERFAFNRPRYARSTKARELNLDQKAQLELLEGGFILGDIFALQKTYYRSIAPDILLTRKYGDPNGIGMKYLNEAESMTDPGLLSVAAEYNKRIGFAKGKERAKLVQEKNQTLSDLESSIELLRGTFGLPSDPHVWYSKGMRTMKHYNALTMLTGFAAAIPDVARTVMTSGIKRGFKTQFEMFADFLGGKTSNSIFKMGKKEAQATAEAVDMITGQRAMLFADTSDMFAMTSKLEGVMGKTSQFNFMYLNLMSRWTEFAKSMASVTIGSRILEDSIKWSKAGIKPLDIRYIKIPEGKAMASFNRANNQVVMDLERIQKTFNEKAWTKPRIQGVDPLPANQFKTFDKWKDFIYFHELSHWKNPRLAGETLAAYENRMNKLALDSNNIKALKKAIETEGIAIGGLSDKWKTALAASGIDKQMAARIAKQVQEHGIIPGKNDVGINHNYIAMTANWTDEAAVKAFRGALNKDINVTIVTPGKGDTPLWLSYELGSTFAQFKKFAMASTQRMLMRGMQERDMDFLFGAMLLIGSGMLIDSLYHKTRFNRDYSKVPFATKLMNAFDRSGLAGIYTDINKAIETLSDNRIGISPALGVNKPYGSSNRWKAGTLAGPTGGQLYNIFDILYDVGGNKYNHHTAKNVRRLIPFQNVWYLDWLFDDLQKGLRFK